MTTANALAGWQAAAAVRAASPQPDWLSRDRRAALDAFLKQGLPTPRVEAWRTTNLAEVARTFWTEAPPPDAGTLDRARRLLDTLPLPPARTARLVLVNGHVARSLSIAPPHPGFHAGSLARRAPTLEGRLGRLLAVQDHPFQALNAALWADGLLLEFEPEARPGAPVHVVSVAVGGTDARAVHPRLLVHVGDGAEAAILLTWLAESDGPLLVNGIAEVFVDAGGRLDLLEIEAQSPTTAHVWNVSARLGRDARLAHTRVVGGLGTGLGAGLARAELDVRLDAEGAEATLDGLLLADGTRHVDVQTHVDHAKPNGTSRQLYKCILADRATTAFGGQVQVRAGAQKTNARQSNHNLLLSDTAVADAKPELEILADDVKCAHGATVGQLDEDALFYLRSRGIAPDEARAMLVRAFAREVADRVVPEALREHARAVVRAALAVGAW